MLTSLGDNGSHKIALMVCFWIYNGVCYRHRYNYYSTQEKFIHSV